MTDVLEEKRQTIEGNEAQISISVVRRLFIKTAMEQLMDSLDNNWMKPIRIAFIGEEGGGSLEFFTLLFKKKPTVYDADEFFTIDSQMLQQKEYCLLGKVTAQAIINSHPGPHALNKLLAGYILTGKEPDASDVQTEHIHRGDLHGMLQLLQANQEEGLPILSSGSKYPTPDEVQELYTINYSTGQEEKEIE
ncbi:hypothetical protein MAR_033436 [Mya arenaria]|uniref:Uncharacterized protein n=1 Tax=Mya arenaria TaxID=6604 RepID=A0ABY7GC05_MYAAR|nr:hypothetical protein MAR_033436 [Mya arenaria]